MDGGVDVVQIRETGLEAGAHVQFVRECVAIARKTRCAVLVNDRVDLALVAAAAGVHLRESSIPIAAARKLAPHDFLVGRSVHEPATAERARSADYMIAGSVFDTASKPGRASLGLDGLRRIVAAAGECPVWAIGGITPQRVPAVTSCGVAGVAAIGAFIPSARSGTLWSGSDLQLVEQDVRMRAAALRFSLDRHSSAP